MLMGDAGSRAMGLFIAIAALKCHDPFLYILAALVLIIDGGLGLVKLTLIKTIHVHILKNVRTPIHDFVRKTKGCYKISNKIRRNSYFIRIQP